jgi:hypothetical protein
MAEAAAGAGHRLQVVSDLAFVIGSGCHCSDYSFDSDGHSIAVTAAADAWDQNAVLSFFSDDDDDYCPDQQIQWMVCTFSCVSGHK